MKNEERTGGSALPFHTLDEFLGVIGSGRRLDILRRLSIEPHDVSRLAEVLEVSLPLVSQNLRVLKHYKLVQSTRNKQRHVYRINPNVGIGRVASQITIEVEFVSGDNCSIALRHAEVV